jgi:putative SOS response-associated peptidase YedK
LQGTPEQAAACNKPYPDEFTIVRRVSSKVNSTRNNGPELIVPDL